MHHATAKASHSRPSVSAMRRQPTGGLAGIAVPRGLDEESGTFIGMKWPPEKQRCRDYSLLAIGKRYRLRICLSRMESSPRKGSPGRAANRPETLNQAQCRSLMSRIEEP